MNATTSALHEFLSTSGYSLEDLKTSEGTVTTFENDTVLGFVLYYPDAATLIQNWKASYMKVLDTTRTSLQEAGEKAWNAYLILLADKPGNYIQNMILGNIEEDLVGTRKIARAGVVESKNLRNALMPLLDVQNAPRLDKVDMVAEINLRTSELPKNLMEGFFSEASDSVLFRLLEQKE